MLGLHGARLDSTLPWSGHDTVPPNRSDRAKVLTFGNSLLLTWQEQQEAIDGDKPILYVVYRSSAVPVDISDMRNAVQLTRSRSYLIDRPTTGNYVYTVTALDRNHNESEQSSTVIVSSTGSVIVGVQEPVVVPLTFELQQNYPNPFNSSTVIQFTVPCETHTALKVYDVLGRGIVTLVDQIVGAGVHQANVEAHTIERIVHLSSRCRRTGDSEEDAVGEVKKRTTVRNREEGLFLINVLRRMRRCKRDF